MKPIKQYLMTNLSWLQLKIEKILILFNVKSKNRTIWKSSVSFIKKISIIVIVLQTIHCPIAKKIYIVDSGDTDIIERKDAQTMVNNALWIYVSKCRDEKLQAGILNYWDPILKAKPCGGGNLSLKNSALVYCYEKLFLDKSNIDSCSLLLIAGSCSGSSWQREMALSHTFCKSSLVLENYTNIIKFF